MKKTKILITLFLFILFSITSSKTSLLADERNAVYFKDYLCEFCNELAGYPDGPAGVYIEEDDYLKKIIDQGINLEIYDVEDQESMDIFAAYLVSYGLKAGNNGPPFIFVGDQYFDDIDDIREAVDSNLIYELSSEPLLDIVIIEGKFYEDITGVLGFITVLFAGFLDGFNPCAIAMLILFVSILGFTENKRVLILVSIVYIFALFISYLLIGTLLLNFLRGFQEQALFINKIVSWFVALLCSFLFLLNLYDFYVTRKEDYSKVKNQLPSWIQKFNKKLIKAFSSAINNPENKKGLFSVLGLTFVLGVALSVTELLCTGQIYFGILYGISYLDSLYAYIALVAYNIMFVLPLIVIAVFAIKGKGVITTSNWIREHLHVIKFFNAMLFLGIAIYFFTKIF